MSRSFVAAVLVGFAAVIPALAAEVVPSAAVRAQVALEGARHAYQTAVNLQTNQFEAAWKLCRALIDAGTLTQERAAQKLRFVESEQLARQIIQSNPTAAQGHLFLAIAVGKLALFEGGKRKVAAAKEVQAEAEQAIALNPAEDAAYHVLGLWNREMVELNFFLKKFAELLYGSFPPASLAAAQANLRRAVELAPTVVSHRVELGLTLLAAGQRTEGRKQLAAALEMPETWVTDDYYKAIARRNL